MLDNHWENFQELWVPKNGKKQPKLAKIGQNWPKLAKIGHKYIKWDSEYNCNLQIGEKCCILMCSNVR